MDTDTTPPATASPEAMRASMVDKVHEMGHARRPQVERVLRKVPRHQFVPDADLQAAYDPWQAVITKRHTDGSSLSCASAPFVVAMMLDQLDVQPGNRVLEIGAGTGYNAALLAELTGRADLVTTVDIDPDVTAQAFRALAAAGDGDVEVFTGDGALGVPERAPYDRIIATVSPWDISPAWWNQLTPGGRLVAPLRWRGQARSVAFTYQDGRLISDSVELCGFVYLISEDEGEHTAPITADKTVSLNWDHDQPVDPESLYGVLEQPRTSTWSGITVAADEPYDTIWLRLTATDPRTCRINAHPDVSPEVCDPIQPFRTPALVDGESLAYLTSRRQETNDDNRWELGVIGHGPTAAALTERLRGEIQAWSPKRDLRPIVTAYPAGTSDRKVAGLVVDKTHSRITLTYDV